MVKAWEADPGGDANILHEVIPAHRVNSPGWSDFSFIGMHVAGGHGLWLRWMVVT